MGEPAILLMGPTGAGKTDAALALVERLPLEIVSVRPDPMSIAPALFTVVMMLACFTVTVPLFVTEPGPYSTAV